MNKVRRCLSLLATAGSLSLTLASAQLPPDSAGTATTLLGWVEGNRGSFLDGAIEARRRAPTSVLDLIGNQFPGVLLTRAGGAVGAGGRIRIRGASSLLLGTEPLIVVDGIRVHGAPADRSLAFSSHRPSRINDFEVSEIESISVLRGPAAAAMYGSDGANGVIEVVTRRPTGGPTRFATTVRAGTSWFADPEGRLPSNYYIGRDNQIREFNVLAFNRTRGYPAVFSNGVPADGAATLNGSVGRIGYHVSGTGRRETSYLDYDWQHRVGARLNLRYRSESGNLTVHLNGGIRASRLRGASVPQPILTSIAFACNFPGCEPTDGADSATTGWNGPRHGYQRWTPEDNQLVNARDRITRSTGSLMIEHRIGGSFRHRLVVGPDLVRNRSSFRIDSARSGGSPGFPTMGVELLATNDATSWSVDYQPEVRWTALGARAITTAGAHRRSRVLDYRQRTRFLGQTSTSRTEHSETDGRGMLLHQRLSWARLDVKAGLRGDQPGFGEARGTWSLSPMLGVTWSVIGRHPTEGQRTQVTVNGAWGRIPRGDQSASFSRAPGGNLGPVEETARPERVDEWEIGFSVRRAERIATAVGWYHRRVPNLLDVLPRTPSGSGGGVLNRGSLTSRGLEVAVDAVPLHRGETRVDVRLALTTNRQTLDDLALVSVLAPVGPGQAHVSGFAPGSYFVRRVVGGTVGRTSLADGRLVPTATDLVCEGGEHLGRGNGTTVPCDAAPLLYAGRPSPSWFGSLNATFSHRRWWTSALVDGVGGHSVLVGEVFGAHTLFLNSRASLEGTDPVLVGTRLDRQSPYRTGLFRAGFLKLRTVVIGVALPVGVARSLGAKHGSVSLVGDNLWTLWRAQRESYGVPWVDPETIQNRAEDITGVSGFAQDGFPLPARIRVGVQLEF